MLRIAGKVVGGFRIAGKVAAGVRVAGNTLLFAAPDMVYTISRTLDRTWGPDATSGTPGSGGGNVDPDRFEHEGNNWELWQCVPYLNANVGPVTVGDCRIHLRNRDVSRGTMQLTDMPDEIVLTMTSWQQQPWTFRRPTDTRKFTNVGSGNSARKGCDYEPTRTVLANPGISGIAQGQTFTIDLIWKA